MTRSTVNLVIGGLVLLAVLTVVGGIYLTANDKSLPGEIIAIGSAAAGAVAGILSRTGHVQDETGSATVTDVCLVLIAATFILWALGYVPLR